MAEQTGTVLARVRQGHEERVLGLLRQRGALSRAELVRSSGLSRTTLSGITAALLRRGQVIAAAPDEQPRGRGRPAERVMLNPASGQAVGIDFARRRVLVTVANVAHEVVASSGRSHPLRASLRERLGIAVELIGRIADRPVRMDALKGIGVGVVGPVVNPGTPAVTASWHRRIGMVPEILGERYGVPVLLDNNVRLSALAESIWGAGAGHRDLLCVRLSYGVGGGLLLGGALVRGAQGVAGEIGHITAEADGAPCTCGKNGCLEAYLAVRAVLSECGRATGRRTSLEQALTALRAGDAAVRGVFDRAGYRLGVVLAAMCNGVGPELIVVGGELAAAGEVLLPAVGRALTEHALPAAREGLKVRMAELGDDAGALGGIALVLHASPALAGYPEVEEASSGSPGEAPPRAGKGG